MYHRPQLKMVDALRHYTTTGGEDERVILPLNLSVLRLTTPANRWRGERETIDPIK